MTTVLASDGRPRADRMRVLRDRLSILLSENRPNLRTILDLSKNYVIFRDMATLTQEPNLRSRLLARMADSPEEVWTPRDFAELGSRAAVDKTLQRLVAAGELRAHCQGAL